MYKHKSNSSLVRYAQQIDHLLGIKAKQVVAYFVCNLKTFYPNVQIVLFEMISTRVSRKQRIDGDNHRLASKELCSEFNSCPESNLHPVCVYQDPDPKSKGECFMDPFVFLLFPFSIHLSKKML
uniref:Uncharacterized protein n=1 Tax=Heterorhabditis bacteriophora TaxID=37862 RepID=A0A1I7WTI7_HETBA